MTDIPLNLLRRHLLLGGAALALPASALAQAAPRAGTLKVAFLGLDTADPHRHTGSIAVQQVYVEALTSIADDGTVKPFLATAWEISPDGRRYSFTIREGVRFHNGRLLTAEDVRANAVRVRDQVRGGWLSAPMRLVETLEAPDFLQLRPHIFRLRIQQVQIGLDIRLQLLAAARGLRGTLVSRPPTNGARALRTGRITPPALGPPLLDALGRCPASGLGHRRRNAPEELV